MSLFGEGFVRGGNVLSLLVIGQLVNIATGPVGWVLSLGKAEWVLFANNLFALTVMFSLSFWLIPEYGALGAGVAQVSAITTQMLLGGYFSSRIFNFSPLKALKLW